MFTRLKLKNIQLILMKGMFMQKESWEIEPIEKDLNKARVKLLAVCAAAITSVTLAENTLVAV